MKKLIAIAIILFAAPVFAADITITGLTESQVTALVGQNMTKYVADLANHLILKKVTDEKFQLIKVLTAKTEAELSAAAAPIIAAEKAKAEALPK